MYNYLQMKHTTEGDVLGQTLTFEKRDQWLLEYHSQMKNAINNEKVIGMNILVIDEQLNQVFRDDWIREIEPKPEPEPSPEPEPEPEPSPEPEEPEGE